MKPIKHLLKIAIIIGYTLYCAISYAGYFKPIGDRVPRWMLYMPVLPTAGVTNTMPLPKGVPVAPRYRMPKGSFKPNQYRVPGQTGPNISGRSWHHNQNDPVQQWYWNRLRKQWGK
jgi:hypothetical protein